MKHITFSQHMKLADLLLANYKLLLVLNRFNIHLGFGEKSIEEVCAQQGISTPLFLLVCNVYTFTDYLPQKEELKTFSVADMINYLQNSHTYYKEGCLPRINNRLMQIVARLNTKQAIVLQRFYEEYQKEVLKHFAYEEKTVYPYAWAISKGEPVKAYSISQFQKHHSNIEEKINDLKNIIIKYLPDTGTPDELNALLFDLFELEDDFSKHTLIEDKILVSLVLELENGI